MTRQVMITRHPRDCVELAELLLPAGLTVAPYPVMRVEDVGDEQGWRRLECPCGTVLKLPPDFAAPRARCPRCGRIHAL